MRENRFGTTLRQKLRDGVKKYWSAKLGAGGYQVTGLPDIAVIIAGIVMFIELKTHSIPARPSTVVIQQGMFTALQLDTMKKMEAAGANVFGLVLFTNPRRGGTLVKMSVDTILDMVDIRATFNEVIHACPTLEWPATGEDIATLLTTEQT